VRAYPSSGAQGEYAGILWPVAGDVLEDGETGSLVQIGRVEVDPAVLAGPGQPLSSLHQGRVAQALAGDEDGDELPADGGG
jgi:hypothetical protein